MWGGHYLKYRSRVLPQKQYAPTYLWRLEIVTVVEYEVSNHDLPQEIESWIYALLRRLPDKLQSLEAHRPSNIERGVAGNHSLHPLIFPRTYSSKSLQQTKEQPSSPRLHIVTDRPSTLDENFIHWVRDQSGAPWTMGHRPSRCTNIPIHGSIWTKSHHDFYNNNTEDTKT